MTFRSVLAGAVVSLVAALVPACSSSSGGSTVPTDCVKRCRAYASMCMNDVAQCDGLCTTITEAQLACLEHADCDHDKVAMCLPTSGGAGGSGGSGTGGAGGTSSTQGQGGGASGGDSQGAGGNTIPMCLGDGEAGCTNAAEGPNCCAPSVCDPMKKVCCTQNVNATCEKDADCCGAGLGTVRCIEGADGGKVCVLAQ